MEHAAPPRCPRIHCPHPSLLGSGNISTEHRPVISSAHHSRMTREAFSHRTDTHMGTHRHRIKAQTDWFLLFKFPCLSALAALKNRAPPFFPKNRNSVLVNSILLQVDKNDENVRCCFSFGGLFFSSGSYVIFTYLASGTPVSGERPLRIHAWTRMARLLLSDGLCLCSRPDVLFLPGNSLHCGTLLYALSGTGARVASESAKSSAESMRQLAASLGRERFLPFWFMQSPLVQIQDAMNDFS